MIALKLNSSLLSLTKHIILHRRKKPSVKEPLPKRAKVSPATVPPILDAPIPSPIRDDTHMEEAVNQICLIPETNPSTKATAKDVIQGGKALIRLKRIYNF
jgi:hypothetical protein